MEFWAGELGNNHIKGIKHSNVMDSVFNYLEVDNPKINYSYENLFLDNGAFSIFKNNFHEKKPNTKINNDVIINIQETSSNILNRSKGSDRSVPERKAISCSAPLPFAENRPS